MPRTTVLLLSILIINLSVSSQNLIPDPGFEDWNGTIGMNPNTLGGLNLWNEVNGTPDHHHIQNPPGNNLTSLDTTCAVGGGQNQCGFPCEGLAVLGLYKANGDDGNKEWAATEMTESLVPGECYDVSFWIQNKKDNPNFIMETNQWGVFFSNTPVPVFDPNTIDFNTISDQWVATDQLIDGSEWHEINLVYQASDAYSYAYVGYMGNVSEATTNAWSQSGSVGFYVWMDKVSVTALENASLELTEDHAICLGDSTLLAAITDLPVNWNNGMSTEPEIWVSPMTTTTYYVEVGGGDLCGFTDSVVVTVDELSLDMVPPMCIDAAPVNLSASIEGGTWEGIGITNPNTGTFNPEVSGSGIFDITYNLEGACASNSSIQIEVLNGPAAAFEADIFSGCDPLVVQFTNLDPQPGYIYTWEFGTGSTSIEMNPFYEFTVPGSYDVSLFITNEDGCGSITTYEDYIVVHPLPIPDFVTSPNPVTVDEPVIFNNLSTNGVVFNWDFGDGFGSGEEHPAHLYTLTGAYQIQLIAETAFGCIDSTSRILNVQNEVSLYIPNSFTPDGDGLNDHFQVSSSGPLTDFKLQIFSRWGEEVFFTNDQQQSWLGEFQRGEYYVPSGVYTYVIEYSSFTGVLITTEKITGSITLLR